MGSVHPWSKRSYFPPDQFFWSRKTCLKLPEWGALGKNVAPQHLYRTVITLTNGFVSAVGPCFFFSGSWIRITPTNIPRKCPERQREVALLIKSFFFLNLRELPSPISLFLCRFYTEVMGFFLGGGTFIFSIQMKFPGGGVYGSSGDDPQKTNDAPPPWCSHLLKHTKKKETEHWHIYEHDARNTYAVLSSMVFFPVIFWVCLFFCHDRSGDIYRGGKRSHKYRFSNGE